MSTIYYGRFTLLSDTNTAALNPKVMAKVLLPSIGAERSGVVCRVAVGMGIPNGDPHNHGNGNQIFPVGISTKILWEWG